MTSISTNECKTASRNINFDNFAKSDTPAQLVQKHWLDDYINKEDLTKDQLKYMYLHPLKMFAYGIKDRDYESIKGRLVILQKMLGKGYSFKDVSYILDNTGLTRWQKFWLKFNYIFL